MLSIKCTAILSILLMLTVPLNAFWINDQIRSVLNFWNKFESVKGILMRSKNIPEEKEEEFTTIKFTESVYEFNANEDNFDPTSEVENFRENSQDGSEELSPLRIFFANIKCHEGMAPVKNKNTVTCRKIYNL